MTLNANFTELNRGYQRRFSLGGSDDGLSAWSGADTAYSDVHKLMDQLTNGGLQQHDEFQSLKYLHKHIIVHGDTMG